MLNEKDILARLQNGETVETIAAELTKALNNANAAYTKEQEAQKAEVAKKEKQKIADMQEILDLLYNFCVNYYCETTDDLETVENAFTGLDAKTVIQMVEEASVEISNLEKELENALQFFNAALLFKSVTPVKPKAKNSDDVINNFLSSLGLK